MTIGLSCGKRIGQFRENLAKRSKRGSDDVCIVRRVIRVAFTYFYVICVIVIKTTSVKNLGQITGVIKK